jgi:hypothetical protein
MSNAQGRVVKKKKKKQAIGPLRYVRHPSSDLSLLTVIRSLGEKVVHVGSTLSDRQFTVHEDLVCTGSEVFKTWFQPTRRAIDGQYPICYVELDPTHADLTFCRGMCGHNLHTRCWETWANEQAHPKCPMCRTGWKEPEDEKTACQIGVDPDALQTYVGWLYSRKIVLTTVGSPMPERIGLCNLYAHAEKLEDPKFQNAIMKLTITPSFWNLTGPPTAAVETVFNCRIISEPLRNLLVDLKSRHIKERNLQASWFKNNASSYPSGFVVA